MTFVFCWIQGALIPSWMLGWQLLSLVCSSFPTQRK
jgi:hypothetical protein